MRALRFALAAAAALVEAAIATALVFTSSHEPSPWLIAPFALTAGLSFVAAGLVALWRRPENATGFWLAATGYLWFIAALTESNESWVWTIGSCINNLVFVAFVALILAYPDGILSRRDRWLVAVGGAAAIAVNTTTALVDTTPDDSCSSCPPSAIAVADLPWVKTTVGLAGTVIVAIVLAAVVAILVQRWRRASAAQRRLLRPVYGSCGLSVLLLLVSLVVERADEVAWSVVWVLFLLSFLAVPLTFLAGVLRSRFDRAAVARMLLSLEAGAPLRNTLAESLHDPSLEIVYWLDERAQWVDAGGHRVEEPVPSLTRSVTTVERHDRRIAALVHDPALDNEPELVSSLAAAAALALQTERLQAELRAQFEFLTTIVDTAPSLLVVLETDGRIRNQNRAVLEASGYADEDLVRDQFFWDVFIDADEREEMRERFARAAPEFAPAEYENTFTNAHGEQRVVAWRSAPVKDASDDVISIIAGGIDITERKHRELQLQRERDATETLMQAIPSVVVVVDGDGIVVDRGYDESRAGVNKAFLQSFGWSDADLVHRSVLDLIAEGDGQLAHAAIAAAAGGSPSPEQESRWIRADGEHRVIAWRATPVADVTGRRASLVLLSGVDVTERTRQEEEIRASRSRIVETADETRRKLERNLHDGAQQRLVALSIALRLAEAKLPSDTEAASSILANARVELAQALEELRELARGIHPAVLTDRGLPAAIEALVARAPLPVEVELTEEPLPPAVEAALYYVVAEALTNVVKYANATSARVRLGLDGDGGSVTAEVSDDGIGGADPARGSGLRGLVDRVEALDGILTVESPAAGGTCVRVEVPIHSLLPG